jgi:hypothetical protein
MIRVLALIAGVGFVVSVVCLAIASALGGRDVAAHGWNYPPGWHVNIDDGDYGGRWGGPDTTRQLTWDGSTSLEVSAPAEVRYTQAPGPAKLEVTGPSGLVDRVTVQNGHIDYDGSSHHDRLLIVMSAPNVTHFDLSNRGRLTITGYDQDKLDITMSGRADVNASGKARAVTLAISGRGDADLGGVVADEAKVDISGAGKAVVAPKTTADLDISGSGDVTLLTRPVNLHSDVSGSGRIIQASGAAEPAAVPVKK